MIYESENDLKNMAFSIAEEEVYDFKDTTILSEEF